MTSPHNRRICISIGNLPDKTINTIINSHPFVELRLDLLPDSFDWQTVLHNSNSQVIVTSRKGKLPREQRHQQYFKAIEHGAWAIDCDSDEDDEFITTIVETARASRTRVILSAHLDKLPDKQNESDALISSIASFKPDFIKLAVTIETDSQADQLNHLHH